MRRIKCFSNIKLDRFRCSQFESKNVPCKGNKRVFYVLHFANVRFEEFPRVFFSPDRFSGFFSFRRQNNNPFRVPEFAPKYKDRIRTAAARPPPSCHVRIFHELFYKTYAKYANTRNDAAKRFSRVSRKGRRRRRRNDIPVQVYGISENVTRNTSPRCKSRGQRCQFRFVSINTRKTICLPRRRIAAQQTRYAKRF